MLFRIVAVFIFVLVATSGLDIILARRRRNDTLDVRSVLSKQRRTLLAKIVFWVSTSTLLFHMTGYFAPVEILVILLLSLVIPISAIIVSTLLWSQSGELKGYAFARDRHSGEKIGVIVGNVNDPQSNKVLGYRIRTTDGSLIEKPTDSIMIDV